MGSAPNDIAVNMQRARAGKSRLCHIANLGDIRGRGIEEYDASGFNVVQRFRENRVGSLADLFFYKRDRAVDWRASEIEKKFPPDAVFAGGRWTIGEGIVPKK